VVAILSTLDFGTSMSDNPPAGLDGIQAPLDRPTDPAAVARDALSALVKSEGFVQKFTNPGTPEAIEYAALYEKGYGERPSRTDQDPGITATQEAQATAAEKLRAAAIASGDKVALASLNAELDAKPKAEQALDSTAVSDAPAIAFDFVDAPKMSPQQLGELQNSANQAVRAVGLDPAFARGGVAELNRAIVSRDGKPMDQGELNTFDDEMDRLWPGEKLVENKTLVLKALWRAGPLRPWIEQSILRAGPKAAAMAYQSLANAERNRT
jgi:hypothetical protein